MGARSVVEVEPGSRIGRFEVQDLLGRGGMGAVYAARDPELERSVAIKLIVEPDTHMTMRLLREAQALAQLQHPHVVAIHEVGQHGDGVFLAMELVDGTSLDRLQPKPTSWREIVALFVQAGRGLAAAHDKGLVHRDVKPSNLLVGRDGRVRIGDFGLARLAPRDGEGDGDVPASKTPGDARAGSIDTTVELGSDRTVEPPRHPLSPGTSGGMLELAMTHDGAFLGTPRYMAPEQHACRPATARSDQFSFCVALWEMVFGQHPFELSSMGFTDAVVAGRRAPLPRARAAVAPRWLIRALDRGLSADPDDRFPTMHALVDVLTRTPLRRRRIAVAAGALGAVATTATAAALLWPAADALPAVRCDDAAAGFAAIWSPAQRDAVAARFAAQRPDHGADTARLTAASIDRHGARWSAARVDACRATHERGEQSPELLDRRMGCLERTLAETGAVLATFTTAGPEQVDRALATVDGLPDPAACSAERLSAALPLPDDPRATAIVDGLARLGALRAAGDLPAARALVTELRAQTDALAHPGLRAEVLIEQAASIADTDPAGARAALERAVADAVRANDRELEASAAVQLLDHAVRTDDRAGIEALRPLARAAAQRQGIAPRIAIVFAVVEAQALSRLGRHDEALAACDRIAAIPDVDPTLAPVCRCRTHDDALRTEAIESCGAALTLLRAAGGRAQLIEAIEARLAKTR